MGIGSITSANGMSATQMTGTALKDQKSKSIQTEITDVEQQLQKLSSEEDLAANEKATERKKLQKEKSSLNAELKQHQEELRRSQKREIMLAGLQETEKPAEKEEQTEEHLQTSETSSDAAGKKNTPTGEQQPGTIIARTRDGIVFLKESETKQAEETKEEDTDEKRPETMENDTAADTDLSGKGMHAMVSADSFLQQANRLGTIVSKTDGSIAVLEGEIKLDEIRGTDTERKQSELEKLQKQEQRETAAQFSMLGKANNAMKPAAETNGALKEKASADTEKNFSVSGLDVTEEERILQQGLYVSLGN